MGPMPKLPITELFWFAMFGLACAVVIGGSFLIWGGYHLSMALAQYLS